jgi:hypothetical protein
MSASGPYALARSSSSSRSASVGCVKPSTAENYTRLAGRVYTESNAVAWGSGRSRARLRRWPTTPTSSFPEARKVGVHSVKHCWLLVHDRPWGRRCDLCTPGRSPLLALAGRRIALDRASVEGDPRSAGGVTRSGSGRRSPRTWKPSPQFPTFFTY